jgi:hypothetical protein
VSSGSRFVSLSCFCANFGHGHRLWPWCGQLFVVNTTRLRASCMIIVCDLDAIGRVLHNTLRSACIIMVCDLDAGNFLSFTTPHYAVLAWSWSVTLTRATLFPSQHHTTLCLHDHGLWPWSGQLSVLHNTTLRSAGMIDGPEERHRLRGRCLEPSCY